MTSTASALFPRDDRPHVRPPRRPYPRLTLRQVLLALFLSLFLCSGALSGWADTLKPAQAAVQKHNPNPPLKPPAWLKRPRGKHIDLGQYVHVDPSVKPDVFTRTWPVSMPPATITLTGQPQQFIGKDGRLEIDIAAGTVTPAEQLGAGGSIILSIRQVLPASGGTTSGRISFGTYQLLLEDAAGHPLSSLALVHPLVLRYHLFQSEETLLVRGQVVYALWRPGDASTLISGFPAAFSSTATSSPHASTTPTPAPAASTTPSPSPTASPSATPSPSPTATPSPTPPPAPPAAQVLVASGDKTGLIWSVATALASHAKTVDPNSFTALSASTISFNTTAPQALWGTPTDFQVDLNSGGLMYRYPLDIPPGPGGLVPNLTLSYNSGAVDESHSLQAAAPWVGEGWSLDLGSISFTQENVTPGGTNRLENVWHINDSFGISGQLIPPDLNASTTPLVPNPLPAQYIWHTAPESHAKVQEIQGSSTPCWRVWLPSGIWEDFGCTPDSKHSYVDSHGTTIVWRWDVDLIVDRHGNQIHITYQSHFNADNSVRDAVLNTVEYDDPGCHNATTRCSTWNPQVKILFTASRVIPTSPINQLLTDPGHSTDSACLTWAGNNSYRCDDPVDHSGTGGLPVPKILNSYALLNAQVQVNGNVLREYLFKYEQTRPQDITDPASGKTESISGSLDLGEIDQLGTGGTALNAPVITIDYGTHHEHYADTSFLATPTTNCSPSGWSPKNGSGQCYLWSRTYNTRYISMLDNGRGWHENVSWVEGRNNTHGVNSGLAINNATSCDGHESSTNLCGRADDQNWSRMAVQSRSAVSNGVTSTWSYDYYIRMNWPAPPCPDCNQGYDWGNQNDGDYADYYNGQFLTYSKVVVTAPDNSQQVHRYASSEGWGLALSTISCAGPFTCHVDPYWDSSNIEAGKDQEEDDYDTTGALLSVHQWNYADNCPPPGVPHSGHSGGSGSDPGGTQLISELDENNPVVVCDPRVTSEDTYQVNGVTDINGYQSDSRVVTKHIAYSHDTDDQGVSHYDYGNTNNIDVSGNDLGGNHFVTHYTMYPHDDLGNNIYLVNLPAITQVQDGSGNPLSCGQSIYGSNSNATTAPNVPDVTQQQDHTVAGSSGCSDSTNLVTVKYSYDASGNPITATDGNNNLGCPGGSPTYSACANYDSFATHLVGATNAMNQTTTSGYTTTAAGGFGQWLTSMTDVNGQATSYQYDVLGRLTTVIRPGDSPSSPTVSYSYINNCSNGSTSPCIELDTSMRFTVGGPTTTMKQWYDGWGHLVETQTPGPNSGTTIATYSVYDNMGRETTKSLPYNITTPSGYVSPDLTKARIVTSYDGLGRSLGSITYSNATTIVTESSLSYTVAQGVSGLSSDSGTPFERTTLLDAYNHQGINYVDALARLRYTQMYRGTASPYNVVRTVSNTYDLLGDITAVQTYDSSGTVQASYSATFDALKRRLSFTDSDLGTWAFGYDSDNNVTLQSENINNPLYHPTINTSYDALDRPLCRWSSGHLGRIENCQTTGYVQYFYDSYNNASNPSATFPSGCLAPPSPYASDPVGRPTAELFGTAAGPNGWRCYGYDQRGQQDMSMLSVTANGQTTSQMVNMSYNDGGELTGLVYPDGETLTSQYDVNGRFQSVYFGTSSTPDPVNFLVGQTTYTGSGQLSSLALGGSGPKSGTPTPVLTLNFGYDGIRRPQSTSATEGGSTIWSQTRTYDNVGNVLQLATTVPTVGGGTQTDNQSFCYDALSRLIWAGNSGTPTGGDHCGNAPSGTTLSTYQQSFSYDDLDRMTSGPAGTITYGDSNHVHAATNLSSIPNQYASYDPMGNMTCRNTDTTSGHTCGSNPTGALMTYDVEGRLTSWTAPSGTTATDTFLYDGEGNRVLQETSTSSVTDTITFDGYTETVLSGGTITPTKYYNVNGERVAMKTNGTLSYLLADALSSATIALDSTGATQAVQLFAPYGSVRYSQGTMPTTYNFTGQRLDSQTGLLYYNFRYYDPLSGRFTRADTVETNSTGRDAYAYVADNPETNIDPSGHGGGPVGHVDIYDKLVEVWYILIELYAGNTAYGEPRFNLGGHSIENAKVPGGLPLNPSDAQIQNWLKYVAKLAQSGKGMPGTVGIPDIINKSLHLIYDVKTGDTYGDPRGRSDYPSNTTLKTGWGQVRWYTAMANQSQDSFWNDGYVWNPGDLDHDQPLAQALARCGGACSINIGNGLLLVISYGGPGLLVYKVINTGTPIREAPAWESKYNYWLKWLLPIAVAAIAGLSGMGTGGGSLGQTELEGAGGGGCSFTSDTVIGTPTGAKAIGQLVVGDLVLTYNPLTHHIEVQPIVHVWVHGDNDLVDVVIVPVDQMHTANKQEKAGELIHTTSTHPFLTQEAGFVPVSQLQVGMHILQANGDVGVIAAIQVVPGSMIMYNLEVAKDHTFMVGEDQWVVHNTCKPIP